MRKSTLLVGFYIILMSLTIFFVSSLKVEAVNGSGSSDLEFSGSYIGDSSTLFFLESADVDALFTTDFFSKQYIHTMNNSEDKVFTANKIEIRADQIQNGTGTQVIANNILEKTNTSVAYRVAQQFSVACLSTITTLWLYLNYSFLDFYYFRVMITESDLTTIVDQDGREVFGGDFADWDGYMLTDNILEPGKTYYIVFEVENRSFIEPYDLLQTNYWKAELLNNSIYNNGNTLLYNGTAWNPIQNDSWRDMLCTFDLTVLIDPLQVDLKMYLNGTLCNYVRRESSMWDGYEAYYVKYFDIIPTADINVTITLNTTIETMTVETLIRYIYIVPNIQGWFSATPNRINWTLIYSYSSVADILTFSDNMFAYEFDWDFIEFRDQTFATNNLYTGPIQYYDFTGLAAFPTSISTFNTGNITGTFTSPNYCNAITPKVKVNSEFQTTSKFEPGQTVRLDASIVDGIGNPVSGGTGMINFTAPSGQTTSFTGLNATNGSLVSNEITLGSDVELGLYTISVVWTNGREVGCYSFQVEVTTPQAPAPTNWVLIGVIIALAIVSTLLVLKSTGILWGKGPLNVFISHKAEDYKEYNVEDLSKFLQKKKEVGSAFYFEEDLVGNIDDWMKETVPISQILVFIATQQSMKSKDCQNEINLAKSAGIDIIPIKGRDIDWEDLTELGLDRQKGIPFPDKSAEYTLFLNDLYYYVNKFKEELDSVQTVMKKSSVSDLNLIQLATNLSPEKIWRYSRTLIQLKKLNGVWSKDKKQFLREDEIINRLELLKELGKIKDVKQVATSLGIHEEFFNILEDILKEFQD